MEGSPFRSPNVFRDVFLTERSQNIPGPKVIFTAEDGEKLKARITGEAEATRQRMLAEATIEAAQIKAEAHRAGLAQAHEEALAKVRGEWQALWQAALDQVQEAARQILGAREQLVEGLESEMSALALALAARVIGREAAQPETTRHLAMQALDRLARGHAVDIRVAPMLVEALGGEVTHPRWGSIRLVPDPELRAGDVRVTFDWCVADARLDAMLQELAAGMDQSAPAIPEHPLAVPPPPPAPPAPPAEAQVEETASRRVPARRTGGWLS
ncbi:MAG: FliH/SctL family protein [Candidatus Sericytochromatia bacterium]|nr:FliH/SctL family protein [Candidatus Sericytochromatia bacterium]